MVFRLITLDVIEYLSSFVSSAKWQIYDTPSVFIFSFCLRVLIIVVDDFTQHPVLLCVP